MFGFNVFIGMIHDATETDEFFGYKWVMIFLTSLPVISLICVIILLLCDKKYGGNL